MTTMRFEVVGVDEDIVEVDDDGVVEEILEDVVHEALESRRGIGKPFGDDQPLEGTIAGAKGRFPLVTFSYADQMVRVAEVDLRVVASLAWALEEIGDERKRVVILLREAVKGAEVDTKSEGAIFLLDEEDWSAVRR